MPRRPPPEPPSDYERQRQDNIARNMEQLDVLGLLDNHPFHPTQPEKDSAEKRPYTKMADKVVPREHSTRERKAPDRLSDELFGDDFFAQEDDGSMESFFPSSGHDKLTCFCGKAEDDMTGQWVPCMSCDRLCHATCAGISGDISDMLTCYSCPDLLVEMTPRGFSTLQFTLSIV